ncbi:helix-turn-helix transcriptional regulator [Kitasatospora sp. NPDC093558]|uniref:helix-turn-helix domain-containing protein n=1 Tax=Kitasatospora sp. NPDC093558 TaxID=3155201 RepID=UPI00342021D1
MAVHPPHGPRKTPTGSPPLRDHVPEGAIAGYLFKVIREQIPRTQDDLAGDLGVDKSTLQGWESGRRPLSSTRAGNLIAVRRRLILLGAPSSLVEMLGTAIDADLLLGEILRVDPAARLEDHPLAGWVLTRESTHMIGWAISGVLPAVVAAHSTLPAARRGPVSTSPLLAPGIRARFYESLRTTSEAAERAGEDAALLRRQVWYLSSYDRDWDAAAWFEGLRRRGAVTATVEGWSPGWAEARSIAATLARQGDPSLMRDFINRSIADHDEAESANLNYWAHWLGLDGRPQTDDAFMAERDRPVWDASALLRAFALRIDRAVEYTDLYVHSIWALIVSRRGLLESCPHTARELVGRVIPLLDGNTLSMESRRELESVHYGLRISGFSA